MARFHRRGRSGCLPSGSRRAKMMHARLPPKQPQHPSVKPARGQHAPALLCKTSSASEHCVSAIVDREEATSRPMFSSGGMPRSNAVRKHLTSEGVARPGRRRWPASRPGRRRRPASRSRQNRLITALCNNEIPSDCTWLLQRLQGLPPWRRARPAGPSAPRRMLSMSPFGHHQALLESSLHHLHCNRNLLEL